LTQLHYGTACPMVDQTGQNLWIFLWHAQDWNRRHSPCKSYDRTQEVLCMRSEEKCVARVVHVQPDSFPGGRAGIGVRIERYGAAAMAGERLAS
jgi:hypothetical protein